MQKLLHWIVRESWIAVLELAVVAALAVSLAFWTWQVIAPPAVAAPAPSSIGAGPGGPAPVAARGLLGAGEARSAAPARAVAALTLVGVFAGQAPGSGRALIARSGDRAQLVVAGEEIAPGVVLNEVHADHVTVLRGAALERIELERRGAGGAQARPAGTPAAKPSANSREE